MLVENTLRKNIVDAVIGKYGKAVKSRIELGVSQAAALWQDSDGTSDEFAEFCIAHFIADDARLEAAFGRFDEVFEALHGHLNAMTLKLRQHLDEDLGEIQPYDMILGEFDPSAHLTDDLFRNKIAFFILLNFPHYPLGTKQKEGTSWSSKRWALARIGDMFKSRVPATLQQELSSVITSADTYIAEYNIFMGNLRSHDNRELFPADLKLISHWGLRDELKGHYGRPDGIERQEIIYEVMKRIITQKIPKKVINNPNIVWNPFTNTIEQNGAKIAAEAEPDERYRHIINCFRVMRRVDDYYPAYPTYIKRKFELEREMPEREVEQLFSDFLSAAQLKRVGALIAKRLGRTLRPYDIWYDGFKSRSSIPETELDKAVSARYKNIDAFADDLPGILAALGFSQMQIDFIVPKIEVDASRGAGHAWGASMRDGKAHLRTRVPKGGMDYKGFNTGMHELGHVVEQTLSLHKVDYHLIHGVPFSAFSEAFAFVFQNRDLDILGMHKDNPDTKHLDNLDLFWSAAEIMGVSLVDMKIWNWLYSHPEADAAQLKDAAIAIAKDIWNHFFADAFGAKDEIILGIYSHMIGYPLYLAEYPLGHVMQYQIETHLEGKNLGAEMERMCSFGSVIPQLWMHHAVGSDISVKPMLAAVDRALERIA